MRPLPLFASLCCSLIFVPLLACSSNADDDSYASFGFLTLGNDSSPTGDGDGDTTGDGDGDTTGDGDGDQTGDGDGDGDGDAVCGNGVVEVGEQCDDGVNSVNGPCPNCQLAYCGDGYVRDGVEECDGDDLPNDECTIECLAVAPECGGVVFNPGNGIQGCWYTADSPGLSCTQVCAAHGGFDTVASQHEGNAVGMLFWPDKASGYDWESIECSSTDNNTNWGANGAFPDPNFTFDACYVNCACVN